MNISKLEKLSNTSFDDRLAQLQPYLDVAKANRNGYLIAGISGLAIIALASVVGATSPLLITIAVLGLLAGFAAHIEQKTRLSASLDKIDGLSQRLAIGANSSRVLAGVKLVNTLDKRSSDARLAAAARMATEYDASVVFNLQSSHGVLAPANWSYDGDLGQIRDAFETTEGNSPGALAARQGAAIVMSHNEKESAALPDWAINAGFTQGIVTPVNSGLDTVGVVYVLNKSQKLPTLSEIEQLELLVSFSSMISTPNRISHHEGFDSSARKRQPFRTIESPSSANSPEVVGINMPGFSLDPSVERMKVDGISVSLSPTEFSLVHTLASKPGTPVSPAALMKSCWSKDSRPADNAVDVAIFRLRRKLGKTSSGKSLIKTVRGSGYMFVPPVADSHAPILAD